MNTFTTCPFCDLATNSNAEFSARLIKEFEYGYWLLFHNQRYYGHSLLVCKPHVREWHELPSAVAVSLNENLCTVSRRIQTQLTAHKMNLASFGNVVEHLHWHIVPRYADDPDKHSAPHLNLENTITPEIIQQLKALYCSH